MSLVPLPPVQETSMSQAVGLLADAVSNMQMGLDRCRTAVQAGQRLAGPPTGAGDLPIMSIMLPGEHDPPVRLEVNLNELSPEQLQLLQPYFSLLGAQASRQIYTEWHELQAVYNHLAQVMNYYAQRAIPQAAG